jgi:fatty acid CoA ligase FadD9
MLSLVATGIAPGSFYELDANGNRQRAHYDGLPVEFIAEAISTLGERVVDGFETYHVMNPYDDGIGTDEYVDWLIDAGYPIERIADYAQWIDRFETSMRALPEKQRQGSLLPLVHNYQRPGKPINGAMAPTDRFRAAVQDAKVGPDKDIPHVTREIIVKYITDRAALTAPRLCRFVRDPPLGFRPWRRTERHSRSLASTRCTPSQRTVCGRKTPRVQPKTRSRRSSVPAR